MDRTQSCRRWHNTSNALHGRNSLDCVRNRHSHIDHLEKYGMQSSACTNTMHERCSETDHARSMHAKPRSYKDLSHAIIDSCRVEERQQWCDHNEWKANEFNWHTNQTIESLPSGRSHSHNQKMCAIVVRSSRSKQARGSTTTAPLISQAHLTEWDTACTHITGPEMTPRCQRSDAKQHLPGTR